MYYFSSLFLFLLFSFLFHSCSMLLLSFVLQSIIYLFSSSTVSVHFFRHSHSRILWSSFTSFFHNKWYCKATIIKLSIKVEIFSVSFPKNSRLTSLDNTFSVNIKSMDWSHYPHSQHEISYNDKITMGSLIHQSDVSRYKKIEIEID